MIAGCGVSRGGERERHGDVRQREIERDREKERELEIERQRERKREIVAERGLRCTQRTRTHASARNKLETFSRTAFFLVSISYGIPGMVWVDSE